MAGTNTTEWRATLEAVAQRPPDEANAEWEWLMEQLELGPEYFLAIYEAVQEGRWRGARDPKAYLKTVAKRVAAEMELPAPEVGGSGENSLNQYGVGRSVGIPPLASLLSSLRLRSG